MLECQPSTHEHATNATLVRVQPWTRSEAPTEAAVRRQVAAKGLPIQIWSNDKHTYYEPHTHAYFKVIYVLEGEITFSLPELGCEYQLRPGDRMELPPGVLHHAFVGPAGVRCLESKHLGS